MGGGTGSRILAVQAEEAGVRDGTRIMAARVGPFMEAVEVAGVTGAVEVAGVMEAEGEEEEGEGEEVVVVEVVVVAEGTDKICLSADVMLWVDFCRLYNSFKCTK